MREGDLVRRAEKLRQTVDPLLPRLVGDAPAAIFDRLREELEQVRSLREDAKALDRKRRWGEPLPRALAGLLKFYLDRELPGVVVAPVPGGEVSFAPLAAAPSEVQVAIQHFDDPHKLLLGYLRLARKGLHFFASRESLVCTGRSDHPPPGFIESQIREIPYRLSRASSEGRFLCPHLLDGQPIPYLEVGWPGASTALRICRRCAKSDQQLLASLTLGVAVPDPREAFPVSASLNVTCRAGPDCVHAELPDLPRGLRKRYEYGRLSDAELLDAYRDELRPRLEGTRRPTFVAGGVCFGGDREAFLDALAPSPPERRALEEVLPGIDGLFEIAEPSASRALERLWKDHADTIVHAIVSDPREARRLVQEARQSPGRVSELLHRAQKVNRERAILDALPQYPGLAPEAAYVDAIAREFRVRGANAAEKLLLQRLPKEGKERSLGYGLLEALHRGGAHAWQFTPTEREFGSSLATAAEELLTVDPGGYDASFRRLLSSAGVANWRRQEEIPGLPAKEA